VKNRINLCVDCAWCRKYGDEYFCGHSLGQKMSPVTGQPIYGGEPLCMRERTDPIKGKCLDGKNWKKQ
jgi:hypothetical protein